MLSTIVRTLVAAATFSVALAAQAQGVTGDVQAGHKKAEMCIGCHGIPGYQNSFPEIHKVPKISGQTDKYIVAALNAYKKGDRKHPTMRGIADSLSDQDMADVAAYYAASGTGGAAPAAAPAPTGKVAELITKGACISCHGEGFNKPIDPAYPKIAGQHADYLFVALKAYKTENNANVGRSNSVMAGVAKQFSNAELKELSKYVGGLQGELKTVPQSKFR